MPDWNFYLKDDMSALMCEGNEHSDGFCLSEHNEQFSMIEAVLVCCIFSVFFISMLESESMLRGSIVVSFIVCWNDWNRNQISGFANRKES